MSHNQKFEFGDRVSHAKRPEWGIGSVVKAEMVTIDGAPCQRVSVRFPNAGIKTLLTSQAELEIVAAPAPDGNGNGNGSLAMENHPIDVWRAMDEKGWLEPLAKRKIEETMLSLPLEARDPFNSLRSRLAFTADLYRFDRTGGKLLDWAVAQSGLDDPLTRFTRHDLEKFFDRWSQERESQLLRLLQEARTEAAMVRQVFATAPATARDAVRRLNARALT